MGKAGALVTGIARLVVTARFPRAAVYCEILALADLCRKAAKELDTLADRASNYETCSLRRLAHGIVRELFAEVSGQVTL
jgi:hypothetical protein